MELMGWLVTERIWPVESKSVVLVPSGLAREILTGLGAKIEMNLQASQSLNFTVNNFSI